MNELKKHKYHHSNKQDKELHRHFCQTVEQKCKTALRDRFAGQITLNLRLIRSEIGKCNKHAADKSGPYIIPVVKIEREVDSVQLSHYRGYGEGVLKRDVMGKQTKSYAERDTHSRHHNDELEKI